MDQSVYVRTSIEALATEGLLGAVLCSLVILLFLGRWRMTLIAIMTIPISVLAAISLLYATGNTINVMTLSGLSMAIGPMVDSAIISLENIDRHLERGAPLRRAALDGPAEVALPELVASLSTLTVLAPLALMPSSGQFLFKPMALAVGFAMGSAYILSRTFVPARAAGWLKENETNDEDDEDEEEDEFGQRREPRKGWIARAFDRWQEAIESGIGWYGRRLEWVLDHTIAVVAVAFVTLLLLIAILAFPLRREFFPEVDAGAFEIFVRAPSGTKLEKTNDRIAEVEDFLHQQIAEDDLKLIVSEIGVTPDWSAGYTHNAGKMDAIVRVQLTEDHQTGAYEYADQLRTRLQARRALLRPRIRVQRRRIDPRRSQPGQAHPHQYPRGRQGYPHRPQDRRPDSPQDRRDRRRRRRPHHPAPELPRLQDRRRPCQERRPGPDAGRRHQAGHCRLQLIHPVQQAHLLGRSRRRQPVLRRSPVSSGRHHVSGNPARRSHHRRQSNPSGSPGGHSRASRDRTLPGPRSTESRSPHPFP